MESTLRIANCSGFYGDRFSAARDMVLGGDIDVLTGDYLAELTMFILSKARSNGRPGYAVTFLRQMEEVLGTCLDRGIKIVVNAGGLDPAGLARDLGSLGQRLGLAPKIAHITGDDLMPVLSELESTGADLRNLDTGEFLSDVEERPVTANAYLGARGIAQALSAGPDIVVCPRVTDASLVVGPCMWRFGWAIDDYDKLAGAVAAGHVIECGAQATGGNYAFFEEIPNAGLPGFPIAEMEPDGSSVITKHEGTGGLVSTGTVTAQLVYEIGDRHYLNPDVTLELDTVQLAQQAPDRVRISGAHGTAPPSTTKVVITCEGPYQQSVTFGIAGEETEAKAAMAREGLLEALGGREQFDDVDFRLVRQDHPDATVNELSVATFIATFTAKDKNLLGRRIFDAATGLALSSYPGIYFPGQRQQKPTQVGINWPCLVSQSELSEVVVFDDGTEQRLPPRPESATAPVPADTTTATPPSNPHGGQTTEVSLGTLFGARSGDKGANANVGIWARDDDAFAWLDQELTVEAFRNILPETNGLDITRTRLPNLRAVNFVVHGLLGKGAAAGSRFDPQAKSLSEFVRSRTVAVPAALVEHPDTEQSGRTT